MSQKEEVFSIAGQGRACVQKEVGNIAAKEHVGTGTPAHIRMKTAQIRENSGQGDINQRRERRGTLEINTSGEGHSI